MIPRNCLFGKDSQKTTQDLSQSRKGRGRECGIRGLIAPAPASAARSVDLWDVFIVPALAFEGLTVSHANLVLLALTLCPAPPCPHLYSTRNSKFQRRDLCTTYWPISPADAQHPVCPPSSSIAWPSPSRPSPSRLQQQQHNLTRLRAPPPSGVIRSRAPLNVKTLSAQALPPTFLSSFIPAHHEGPAPRTVVPSCPNSAVFSSPPAPSPSPTPSPSHFLPRARPSPFAFYLERAALRQTTKRASRAVHLFSPVPGQHCAPRPLF